MRNVRSHITGPLPPNSPAYIERTADKEVLQTLHRMEYVQLSEPRQQGKTSLIYRVRDVFHQLNAAYRVIYVSIETLNKQSEAAWYTSLCERLLRDLVDFIEYPHLAAPTEAQSWRFFLSDLLHSPAKGNHQILPQIVIALDGIEYIPEQWTTSFFQVLREIYMVRSITPEFQRLCFILAGSFEPSQLIKDYAISPFNIAQRINLLDFDKEQVRLLIAYTLPIQNIDNVAARLFYWTDGQPYLTQQLCRYLEQESDIVAATVDKAVDRLLREDINHLPRITKLLETDWVKEYVERTITQPIRFAPALNTKQFELVHVYGLLKSDEYGLCRVRNHIYEMAFEMGPIWQEWKDYITETLKNQGEITQKESAIPEFVWTKVTKQYEQENTAVVTITDSERIVVKTGLQWIKELYGAFEQARSELHKTRRLERAGSLLALTNLLEEVVGLKGTNSWWIRGVPQANLLQGTTFDGMGDIPHKIPIIFLPASHSQYTSDSLNALAGETGHSQHFTFIVPISLTQEEAPNDLERLATIVKRSVNDFVILSYETLYSICVNTDPYTAIRRHVAQQVPPSIVSPFIIKGPVRNKNDMFFGRVEELRTIRRGLPSRSFAIIGNRRIGKTSLLDRVRQPLESDHHYLVSSISYQAESTTPEKVRKDIAKLEQKAQGRSIVQLIDEPDELLEYDAKNRYAISAVWRELSETGRCRFVFAGHRILRRCITDVRSPFFNFAEPLPLGFLDKLHACDLFTQPLENLGFQLENKGAMRELVWRVSAGHPNIIQVIGRALMTKLQRGTFTIPLTALESVLDTREFKSSYIEIMWGGETASGDFGVAPLERLILLLGDPTGFTREDIEIELTYRLQRYNAQINSQQVRNALEFLIDFNLLDQAPQDRKKYVCKVKYFLSMIREDIDYLIDLYAKEIGS